MEHSLIDLYTDSIKSKKSPRMEEVGKVRWNFHPGDQDPWPIHFNWSYVTYVIYHLIFSQTVIVYSKQVLFMPKPNQSVAVSSC